jgi:Tol biopolymer transport system component
VERLNDIRGMDIAWSPDGSRIAFVNIVDEPEGLPGVWTNKEIFVIGADGSNLTRLTNHPAWDEHPVWSPDGSLIAFQTRRDELPNDNNAEIYVMDADGSNVTRLTNHPAPDDYPAWSPDGSRIAFMSHRDGNWEIYVMDIDGSNVTNLTNNAADDTYPVWSPNSERRD